MSDFLRSKLNRRGVLKSSMAVLGGSLLSRYSLEKAADATESDDPKEYGRRAKERKAMAITWMKMDLGINVLEGMPGMVMQPAGQSKWNCVSSPIRSWRRK
jgi:hypothetical protein